MSPESERRTPVRHPHILLTGATGFVGGAIARRAREAGHRVTGLVRSPGRASALTDIGVDLVVGDMTEPSTYRDLVGGVDAVVHAAQLSSPGRLTARRLQDLRRAGAVMTGTLADACREQGKRFVHTSGCFTFGDHGEGWITEATPFDPSPLGVGHASEVATLRAMHQQGLDGVVISPGFVYGPGGLFRTAFWDQAVAGRLRCIGAGTNYWSCVHRDDLAAAYVAALEAAPAGAEYIVVDDEPLMLRQLVDAVTDEMELSRVGTIPPVIMGLIVGRPLVRSLVTSFRMRNHRIRDDLGWRPAYPTVADGLRPTVAQLRRDAHD
ncbi:MAG: NAD-dependent epimerase/dehydratase family protein [Kineosporiaceae bacterium]